QADTRVQVSNGRSYGVGEAAGKGPVDIREVLADGDVSILVVQARDLRPVEDVDAPLSLQSPNEHAHRVGRGREDESTGPARRAGAAGAEVAQPLEADRPRSDQAVEIGERLVAVEVESRERSLRERAVYCDTRGKEVPRGAGEGGARRRNG